MSLILQWFRKGSLGVATSGDKDDVAIALGNIADILYPRGNLPAAAKLYVRTLELEASLDPSDPTPWGRGCTEKKNSGSFRN